MWEWLWECLWVWLWVCEMQEASIIWGVLCADVRCPSVGCPHVISLSRPLKMATWKRQHRKGDEGSAGGMRQMVIW